MIRAILHILGCLVPLALLFLLPAVFGVGPGVTFTIFFVLMFVCHLFMLREHGHGGMPADETAGHRNHPTNDTTSKVKGSKSCH